MVLAGVVRAQVFPPGFNDELVVSGLNAPTAMAWLPDGRLLVAQQNGLMRVVEDGALSLVPALQLAVEDGIEQGLLGLAVHPDYPDPPYVYVFYTPFTGSEQGNTNRVSRFTMDNEVADTSSEMILLDNIDAGQGFHLGGCLRFAPDGNLFIGTGDTGWGSILPQDLGSLSGKLLRIRDDGSIPPDNPFVGVSGARPEIYQWGLRNPFRFSLQPSTGTPFIADVGQHRWEEINFGPAGANFGWPECEGACSDPAFTNPLYQYDQSVDTGVIVGNVFYRGTNLPADFVGNFLFFDHARGHLGRVQLDKTNQITSLEFPFLQTASQGWLSGPIDLVEGPDGALYYCTYSPGRIQRIFYTGSANRNPTAVAAASPTAGYAPFSVDFRGNDSFDVDGDTLSYEWDFGDESPLASQANPTHVYGADGVYGAVLTVRDGNGGQSAAPPLEITVGNLPPDVTIQVPGDSTGFLVGQTVFFGGVGQDPEEGSLAPEDLHWKVDLHHLSHIHPVILDETGSGGSFVAGDHGENPADIFYRIHLRAPDSTQLWGATSVDVLPELAPPAVVQAVYTVPSDDRDATSMLGGVRVSGSDPALEPYDFVGNDGIHESAAFEFLLDVPARAQIVDARIVVRAAPLQDASPTGALTIHLYDVADAQPFVDGPFGDLVGHHPTSPTTVDWSEPLDWIAEQDYTTPPVTTLVQEFVDRPDYGPGNFVGFVVTSGTTEAGTYYGWLDSYSGGPATRLELEYRSVATAAPAAVSSSFSLLPVSPNPFQHEAIVSFRLSQASPVRLAVYDAAGRRVRTLLDAEGEPGDHRLVWDGRTHKGRPAAAGVYFIRLQTTGGLQVGRVVRVR